MRAAEGFEAADYVVGGYWVWSKMIENLADIGYDPSNMHMAAYDWRLPAQVDPDPNPETLNPHPDP